MSLGSRSRRGLPPAFSFTLTDGWRPTEPSPLNRYTETCDRDSAVTQLQPIPHAFLQLKTSRCHQVKFSRPDVAVRAPKELCLLAGAERK